MAPKSKKGSGKTTAVLKTTTKVVEETVQISVTKTTPKSPKRNIDQEEEGEKTRKGTGAEKEKEPQTIQVQVQEGTPTPPPSPPNKKAAAAANHKKTKKTKQEKKKEGTEKTKKGTEGEKGTTRKRKRGSGGGVESEGYKRYVHMVMKQVHPDMGISSKAMTIVNNLMSDMFERLAEEAARLTKITGRRTMSSREIQGAVKLVLPGELGKHAIAEGTKAVANYLNYVSGASKS